MGSRTVTERIVVTLSTKLATLGEFRGATVNRCTLFDDGRLFDLDQVPLTEAELTDAIRDINTQALAQLSQLQADYQAKVAELNAANEQIATLANRIAELEAEPSNPFPNADWQGFRSAALASPVIMRMAMQNVGNFMMLLIYITEMQKDQTAAAKMVGVWNEMENKTPLNTDEIAAVNALAQQYNVPMLLNDEGQINI